MITNIVFLKLKNKNELQNVRNELMRMNGNINVLRELTVCENIRNTDFDLVLMATYLSLSDFEVYVSDPLHIEVGNKITHLIENQVSACYEVD